MATAQTAASGKKIVKRGVASSKTPVSKPAAVQTASSQDPMSLAALEAKAEFDTMPKAHQKVILDYLTKWVPKAGYKKLCKATMGRSLEKKSKQTEEE